MAIVGVSAEDRFALLDMSSPDALFAHPFEVGALAFAARQIGERWDLIWDFRASDGLYVDIVDAYREAASDEFMAPRTVLAKPADKPRLERIVPSGTPVVAMDPRQLPVHELELAPFFDGDLLGLIDYTSLISPTSQIYQMNIGDFGLDVSEAERLDEVRVLREELRDMETWASDQFSNLLERERSSYLDLFLSRIASNSLLSELLFLQEGERTRVIPYHSHSLHRVIGKGDELVLMRPGRISARYWATFREDIEHLEALVNDPSTTERAIELQLAKNPLFLRGLNYRQVYTQVVLPEERGPGKRVDVIAEPCDSEWSEVVELKRANEQVLVGRENRATLSSAIHSVVRQLREYRAYFDDRRLAERVEARYGFRCHQPRLTAIVGRDPSGWKDEEISRALTTYPDVRIVTYDQLLRAARTLLLL